MTNKKTTGIIRPLKIALNIIFLIILIIIGVQNAHTIQVTLLWWTGEISLTLLVFLSSLLGGLVMLMFKLINW